MFMQGHPREQVQQLAVEPPLVGSWPAHRQGIAYQPLWPPHEPHPEP